MEIVCPSGKKVNIRAMKGKDEDILVNPQFAKTDETIDQLLSSITGLPVPVLMTYLMGDRMFIIIEFLKLSDPIRYVNVLAPSGKQFEQEIDLDKLKSQDLNEKLSNEKYEFELTYPGSKKKTTARLLTGKDEEKIRKIRKKNPDKMSSFLHMIRTVELDGVKRAKLRVGDFEEMSSTDKAFFDAEYEKRDCGYDTEVILTDPDNFADFNYNLPLDNSFFLGRKKTSKSGKVRM